MESDQFLQSEQGARRPHGRHVQQVRCLSPSASFKTLRQTSHLGRLPEGDSIPLIRRSPETKGTLPLMISVTPFRKGLITTYLSQDSVSEIVR